MFYIYENSTTYIIGKPDKNGVAHPDHRQYYKTMSAAKAGLKGLKRQKTYCQLIQILQTFVMQSQKQNTFTRTLKQVVRQRT